MVQKDWDCRHDIKFVMQRKRMQPAVTIICATMNANEAVRLTLRSLCRYYPPQSVRICIADNGSTDGTWEELQNFPHIKCFSIEERARRMGLQEQLPLPERLHGATLDWLISQVDTPYFLTLDSDVELVAGGIIERMLGFMRKFDLIALGEFERGLGSYKPRLAPHFLMVDTARFHGLPASFRSFVRVEDEEEAARWRARTTDFCLDKETLDSFLTARFYPTGAALLERILEEGEIWGISPASVTSSYVHFGHMSWAETTKASAADQILADYNSSLTYIRNRLDDYDSF